MNLSGIIGVTEILYAEGGRTGVKGVVPPLDFLEFFLHYNANVCIFRSACDAILNWTRNFENYIVRQLYFSKSWSSEWLFWKNLTSIYKEIIVLFEPFDIILLSATIDCSTTVKLHYPEKQQQQPNNPGHYTNTLQCCVTQRGVRGQNGHLLLDVSAEGGPEGVTLLLQNSKCAAG